MTNSIEPLVPEPVEAIAPPESALLTVREVARLLNVGERSVWRWSDVGLMPPPIAIGRSRRWRWTEDLQPWIHAGCPRIREQKAHADG